MGLTLQRLGYVLIPFAAAVAGGAAGAWRTPPAGARSAVQHFAAGVVFAAVAVEVLPDVVHRRRPVAVLVGFAVGVALMLLVRALARGHGGEGHAAGAHGAGASTGLLVAVGVDVLIDGVLLGIGFAAGEREGVLLTAALAAEFVSLGLAVAIELGRSNLSRLRVVGVTAGLALLQPVGAVAGVLVLGGAPGSVMEGLLSLATAALLYLVTEELLVEAHEVPETPGLPRRSSWGSWACFWWRWRRRVTLLDPDRGSGPPPIMRPGTI